MQAWQLNRIRSIGVQTNIQKTSGILLSLTITILILSCNNSGNEPDGGPCTYDKKKYPATVIGIEIKYSLSAEIIFRVNDLNGNIYRDSVLWNMEKRNGCL